MYKLSDEIALVQTVDFFTPMVDDPCHFGQIAAANSLSDIYAMGGTPLTAMNLIGFPVNSLELSVLTTVIQGGLEKIHEAGAVLVGGHSVDDQELKYGLSVTGIVRPDRVWTNAGARAGDRVILTKPLGLGVLNTAIKADMASEGEISEAVRVMARLNRIPAEVLAEIGGIHACTDITGFGLIGHLYNICRFSKVCVKLFVDRIPVIKGAENYCRMGFLPAGAYANRRFYQSHVENASRVPDAAVDLLYDPQTSGGLLACVAPEMAEPLCARMSERGETWCAVIGEVTEQGERITLS